MDLPVDLRQLRYFVAVAARELAAAAVLETPAAQLVATAFESTR